MVEEEVEKEEEEEEEEEEEGDVLNYAKEYWAHFAMASKHLRR